MDKPIAKAVQAAGSVARLARAIHVSAPTIHQWLAETRPIPADRAPAIELQTGVLCEDLCPGEHWQRDSSGKLIGRFIPAPTGRAA